MPEALNLQIHKGKCALSGLLSFKSTCNKAPECLTYPKPEHRAPDENNTADFNTRILECWLPAQQTLPMSTVVAATFPPCGLCDKT